jgi:hypothetical protein
MFELGNIQNKTCGQHAAYMEQNRILNPQKTKASIKITINDKANATFNNSLGTKATNIRHGRQNTNIFSPDNFLTVTTTGFREKVTAFRLLADEIINSSSLSQNIINNLRAYIKELMNYTESSELTIYVDVGETLKKIRDEIQAINSTDKSIIDAHDKIIELIKSAELSLSQFLEMEPKTAVQNETSESTGFSLSLIRQQARKALQCQANINPDKALKLLIN